MSANAVTINVGSGPGGSGRRAEGMAAWAAAASEARPVFVFAQEVPTSGWLDVWEDAGYQVVFGHDRGWRIRSALIHHPDLHLRRLTPADYPTLSYHGSYLAAAVWENATGGPVTVVSVHASPSRAEPERFGWDGSPVLVRNGGGDRRWTGGTAWDSDHVLATLRRMGEDRPVLAAGDFNEARGYDFDDQGTELGSWGREYFTAANGLGFVDCVHDRLGHELPTRGAWQLDHVLASGRAADLVSVNPATAIDPAWAIGDTEDLSDHTALWFTIRAT